MNLIKEEHFKTEVWVNKDTDELRKKECLCFNCTKINDCPIAKELYSVCIKNNVSLMLTKCQNY